MRLHPFPSPFRPAAAFSLPEVAISTGLVAVLILPALAMLVGGNSLQMLAQDRKAASRIARVATSAMVPGDDGSSFEIFFTARESLRVALPGGEGSAVSFAVFDRQGLFLREVTEAEFQGGLVGEESVGTPVYLLSIKASPASDGLAQSAELDPLYEVEISVQQPAAAPERSRSRETFQTRIAAP